MKHPILITAIAFTVVCSVAHGQTVISYGPGAMPTYIVPASFSNLAPTTTYAPATTTYYAPATTTYAPTGTAYAPATMAYAPATAAPFPTTGVVPTAYPSGSHVAYCGSYAQPYYGSPSAAYYGGQPGIQTVSMPPPAAGNCCAPMVACAPQVVLGQSPNQYIGRGIIGQPKLYITGQPVRNALRFLTP